MLVQLTSRDFSFVTEGLSAEVYQLLEMLKLKPNLTQNAAISLLCVLDDHADKIEAFALRATDAFDVTVTKGLRLLTVRHYTREVVEKLTLNFKIVLQQQTPETVQMVLATIN